MRTNRQEIQDNKRSLKTRELLVKLYNEDLAPHKTKIEFTDNSIEKIDRRDLSLTKKEAYKSLSKIDLFKSIFLQ